MKDQLIRSVQETSEMCTRPSTPLVQLLQRDRNQ